MVSSFDEAEYDTPFSLKKSLILSSLKKYGYFYFITI